MALHNQQSVAYVFYLAIFCPTYPALAVTPPNVKPLAEPEGSAVVLAAPAPNLNPPPGAIAKAAPPLFGLSKAEEDFFAVDPGFGVSQQTQDSLSASFGTMQELKQK